MFSTLILSADCKALRLKQDSFLKDLILQGVNLLYPGLATEGTAIQWNINLQNPTPISVIVYEEIAHSLHMGH